MQSWPWSLWALAAAGFGGSLRLAAQFLASKAPRAALQKTAGTPKTTK